MYFDIRRTVGLPETFRECNRGEREREQHRKIHMISSSLRDEHTGNHPRFLVLSFFWLLSVDQLFRLDGVAARKLASGSIPFKLESSAPIRANRQYAAARSFAPLAIYAPTLRALLTSFLPHSSIAQTPHPFIPFTIVPSLYKADVRLTNMLNEAFRLTPCASLFSDVFFNNSNKSDG